MGFFDWLRRGNQPTQDAEKETAELLNNEDSMAPGVEDTQVNAEESTANKNAADARNFVTDDTALEAEADSDIVASADGEDSPVDARAGKKKKEKNQKKDKSGKTKKSEKTVKSGKGEKKDSLSADMAAGIEDSNEEKTEKKGKKKKKYKNDITPEYDPIADESLVTAALELNRQLWAEEVEVEEEAYQEDTQYENEADDGMEEDDDRDTTKYGKECFINRELSWVKFNERVLDEADNENVPLAERLSFAAIYQSNLDEYYMVRVGSIMDQMEEDGASCRENKTGMTSQEQLDAIWEQVVLLDVKKSTIYRKMMQGIGDYGVSVLQFQALTDEEGEMLERYFDHQIVPFLSPMVVSKSQPFPFMNSQEMYAFAAMTNEKGKTKIGMVSCTSKVFPRLIQVPGRKGVFMLSEELILHFIGKLFPKYSVVEKSILRITRNADLDTESAYDEDLDYRESMEQLLKQRKRMRPVRLEMSRALSDASIAKIAEGAMVDDAHTMVLSTPLDLSFLYELQQALYGNNELFYEKRVPQISPAVDMTRSMVDQVAEKDVLLAYPFESMKPFLKLLQDAANDPSVVSIKMTLYRVARQSKVVEALMEAAENGKDVLVMMELRARFDEDRNIDASRMLEEAGCRIIYGLEGYKVHSKLCLITRKTEDGVSYVSQIGTGNYNEKTAALYTDLCLMTGNPEIGVELAQVFNALSMGELVEKTGHLLVAPLCLQSRILEKMDREIRKAKSSEPAYIGVKCNSLTDKALMEKMIEASQAGVKVDLIVRGICCVRPGLDGLTENIHVYSIVGRFLEHSRIYRFGTPENDEIYIGSADLMTRNTLRRVEVATPVYDDNVKKRVRHIFDICLQDTEKARVLLSDGTYAIGCRGEACINSQEELYGEAYLALRQKAENL